MQFCLLESVSSSGEICAATAVCLNTTKSKIDSSFALCSSADIVCGARRVFRDEKFAEKTIFKNFISVHGRTKNVRQSWSLGTSLADYLFINSFCFFFWLFFSWNERKFFCDRKSQSTMKKKRLWEVCASESEIIQKFQFASERKSIKWSRAAAFKKNFSMRLYF